MNMLVEQCLKEIERGEEASGGQTDRHKDRRIEEELKGIMGNG